MNTDKSRKPPNKQSAFDVAIYCIAIAGPVMTLPQLYTVWFRQNVSGVSVLTWLAYATISLFWVVYGVRRRQTPIIVSNGLLLSVDALIVVGILVR